MHTTASAYFNSTIRAGISSFYGISTTESLDATVDKVVGNVTEIHCVAAVHNGQKNTEDS